MKVKIKLTGSEILVFCDESLFCRVRYNGEDMKTPQDQDCLGFYIVRTQEFYYFCYIEDENSEADPSYFKFNDKIVEGEMSVSSASEITIFNYQGPRLKYEYRRSI